MASNNEAKITFKAETSEFRSQVAAANSTMQTLRSEMKLNEAQFQNNGNKADYLKNKQSLLEQQLQQNKAKQTALNQELEIAQRVYGTNSTEAQKLERMLNQTKTQEEQLKTQLSSVNTELKQSENAYESLTGKISRQETELSKLKTEYANAVIQHGKNSTEAQQLAGKIEKLSTDLSENKNKLSDAEGAADQLDKTMDDLGTSAESSSGKFDTMKVALGNLVAEGISRAVDAVKDFAVDTINTGKDFDSSMAQVAATMGVTVDEVTELRDFAKEMGESTAFSASQSADALNYMALAGYDAETSMSMLPSVLNLAAAGGIELADASDMVTDAQSALGLSLDETSTMVDQMAKASSKSNTSVAQLGEAFLTVGGTAKNLKGGTNELSTALGILADNGVKGAEGGTALRNIILSLSAPTDKAAGVLGDLGVAVFDCNGNMRPLNETFGDLGTALSSLSQEERTQALNNIFNKVDLKSVNALLANTTDAFGGIGEALAGCGIEWGNYGTTADEVAGQIHYLTSWEGQSIDQVKQALMDCYGVDSDQAIAAMDAYSASVEANGGRWAELSGYIADADGAAQAMADTQLDNLEGDLTIFGSALEGVQIAVYEKFEPGLRAGVAVMQEVVGYIPGVVDAVIGFAQNIIGAVSPVWQSIQGGANELVTWFTTNMLPMLTTFVTELGAHFTNFGAAMQPLWAAIQNAAGVLFDWFMTYGLPAIQSFVSFALESFNGFLTFVEPIWSAIMQTAAFLFDWFVNSALPIITTFVTTAVSSFQGFVSAVEPIWAAIQFAASVLVTWFTTTALPQIQAFITDATNFFAQMQAQVAPIWEAISSVINTVLSVIATFIGTYLTSIFENWSTIWTAVSTAASTIWESIKTTISTVISAIQSVIGAVMALINGDWSTAWNLIKTAASTIWDAIKSHVETVINAISSTISTVMGVISSAWDTAWNSISNAASTIWNAISTSIGGIIDGIGSKIGSVIGTISTNVSDTFNGIKGIAESVWNGIKSAIENPMTAARDLVGVAIEAIKGFFNFEFKWPSIPLPHFSVSGSLNPADWFAGGLPSIGIEWYAKGGILTNPTLFGFNGNRAMVGGEAGAEAVLPIDTLQTYIDVAFQRNSDRAELREIVKAIDSFKADLGQIIATYAPDSYPGDRDFRKTLRRVGVNV